MPEPSLLNSDGSLVRLLSGEEIDYLETHPDLPVSQEWMREVRKSRCLVTCHCGRLLHVVERKDLHFLRRNPKQDFDEEIQCEICSFEIQSGKYRGGKEPYQPAGFSLLLRKQPEKTGLGEGEARSTRDTIKNKTLFATLHRLMVEAGWAEFIPGRTPSGRGAHYEFWKNFRTHLKKIRVPRTSQGMEDFSWLPLKDFSGGMKCLNERLRNWARLDLPPEAWLFAQMVNSPAEGTAFFYPSPAIEDRPKYRPYRVAFNQENLARIGTVGPWVLFGVGTINEYDDPKFATPKFKKGALQMIAANDWPLPVENSSERVLALALKKMNIHFVKGVFDDQWGLRPDFAIPERKVLISVDGDPEPEIREEKQKVVSRMRQVYKDRRILVWSAFEGQGLEDFVKEIIR